MIDRNLCGFLTCTHRPHFMLCGVILCTFMTFISITVYQEHTDIDMQDTTAFKNTISMISHRHVPLVCYIITLNTSLLPVQLSKDVTCYPFISSRITDDIFGLVSTRVQNNLRLGLSVWGADFTNNISLSIAYNHVQLWHRLAAATTESNMLVFEDDIVLNERPLLLYRKIQSSGVLPHDNYIVKLVNHRSLGILGDVELQHVHRFWMGNDSFRLQKCTCHTRQSFFSSAAYVLDRQAAKTLIQHHLPMQYHVDVFMHYIGCRYSTLFMFDKDILQFSGRFSTHQTPEDHQKRLFANIKETIKNFFVSSCY